MTVTPLTTVDLTAPLAGQTRPELVPLGPGRALAADLARYRGIRCEALAELLPGPAVLVDDAAVFVHTGVWVDGPRGQSMPRCAPLPGKSTRWTSDRRLLRPTHILSWGRAAVTTPVRTCADLAAGPVTPASVAGILALLRGGVDVTEVRSVLGTTFRGRPTGFAVRLLDQIAGAELPVIRYAS